MTGAKKVKVFNHGLRASTVANPPPAAAVNAPVKEAHSDFSATIAPQAAAKVAADAGLELTERYCLVNLWMSVDFANPIMTTPLAFLDAQTVGKEELIDLSTGTEPAHRRARQRQAARSVSAPGRPPSPAPAMSLAAQLPLNCPSPLSSYRRAHRQMCRSSWARHGGWTTSRTYRRSML